MILSVYVGNLPFSSDQNSLLSLFSPFGEVLSARLGRSRGFGFVEMDAACARNAISSLDGKDYEGRKLRLTEAEQRIRH